MNSCYFQRKKQKTVFRSKTLVLLNKGLVVVSVYIVFGLLFLQVDANSRTQDSVNPYQTGHGSVWLLPDHGQENNKENNQLSVTDNNYIEALQMQTDVNYEVTGSIARTKVKQAFVNNSAYWAEGIYVFPLPEKSAVDHFRMIIGERIIEGQIKERIQAKKIYENAKAAGKKASLIEQQRPNVFTTSLANIAPGEKIDIEFEFQQTLDYKDGYYRIRFPLVVGPRYHPQTTALEDNVNPANNSTSVYTETDPVKNTNNPTRIRILLDAGVSLADLNSSYHEIDIKQTSETRYSISTIGEHIKSDRDFELVWKPQLLNKPQLSAFNENINGENFTMLTLLPPDLSHLQQRVQARDIVFVLDISGSMAGTSIEQAKASIITALNGLSSFDRFNLIWFNHSTDRLFSKAVNASTYNKDKAIAFIEDLQANGGTEMLPAMKLALSENEEFSRFKQVVFLTDGNISNEAALFRVIDKKLGNNRLFTIGIGSAPNSYFMRKAASKGRGSFTYIGDVNEVKKKTIALFKKLETPALINIQLDLDANAYEIFPRLVPDLYAGETATIFLKGRKLPRNITVSGDYGNSEWQNSSKLTSTIQSGIRKAWAGEKITSLINTHHETTNEEKREAIKKEITETALKHHLVSRYTSLVAVDITPANTDGMLYRQRLKNNLPHGWKKSTTTNGIMLAQTASGSKLNLLRAFVFFIIAILLYLWKKTVIVHSAANHRCIKTETQTGGISHV